MSGMNGILVVDKPSGWTSFDVIAKLRGILKTRKLGHSGTLDPMATGVLPVFAGGAARAVDMQPNHDKAYTALVRFGLATDTGDVTGETLETSDKIITREELETALAGFLGPQMQTPPMYSAVKINGTPLYKLARQGKTVERAARPVTFYRLELLSQKAPNEFEVAVECSKGTYVRTLVEDVGKALGCPACLAGLRRTKAGVFDLTGSHTLEEIQAAADEGRVEELFLPVETVFTHLENFTVNEDTEKRLLNGAPTYRVYKKNGVYRLQSANGFMGLGRVENNVLKVEKLFVERA